MGLLAVSGRSSARSLWSAYWRIGTSDGGGRIEWWRLWLLQSRPQRRSGCFRTAPGRRLTDERPCPRSAVHGRTTFASTSADGDEALIRPKLNSHRGVGHPPPPSLRAGGCSAMGYTRVSERGTKHGFEA